MSSPSTRHTARLVVLFVVSFVVGLAVFAGVAALVHSSAVKTPASSAPQMTIQPVATPNGSTTPSTSPSPTSPAPTMQDPVTPVRPHATPGSGSVAAAATCQAVVTVMTTTPATQYLSTLPTALQAIGDKTSDVSLAKRIYATVTQMVAGNEAAMAPLFTYCLHHNA
jgi:predicted lipid-binding transport protein (Tim44 family)